jgi:hypothetical protein
MVIEEPNERSFRNLPERLLTNLVNSLDGGAGAPAGRPVCRWRSMEGDSRHLVKSSLRTTFAYPRHQLVPLPLSAMNCLPIGDSSVGSVAPSASPIRSLGTSL